jgi:putative flippase GtrA
MLGRELGIFIIVGSLTVLVDFLSYRGLVEGLVIQVDIAKGSSFLIGTIFAYFMNRTWTFGRVTHFSGTAWRFITLYAITLGANVLVNTWALDMFRHASAVVQWAFLLATGVSAALNFVGMKWFVFKKKPVLEHR